MPLAGCESGWGVEVIARTGKGRDADVGPGPTTPARDGEESARAGEESAGKQNAGERS